MIKVNFKLILDYFIEMYEIFIIEKIIFGNVICDVFEKENMIINIIK